MTPARRAYWQTLRLWVCVYAVLLSAAGAAYLLRHPFQHPADQPQKPQTQATPPPVEPLPAALLLKIKGPAQPDRANVIRAAPARPPAQPGAAGKSFRSDFHRLVDEGRQLQAQLRGRGNIQVTVDDAYAESARSFGARFVLCARVVDRIPDLNGGLEVLPTGVLAPFQPATAPEERYLIRQLSPGDLPAFFRGSIKVASASQGAPQMVFILRPRDLFFGELAAVDELLQHDYHAGIQNALRVRISYVRKSGDWSPQIEEVEFRE